jgi:hypothetical protein
MVHNADVVTPTPGERWASLDKNARIEEIENSLSLLTDAPPVKVTRVRDNGDVFLELVEPLSAGQRGVMLRDLELRLKELVDEALVVWCEPIGDRNSLRKLRGIEISRTNP